MPTAVVVDSDALSRNTFRHALERAGVTTTTFPSLRLAEAERPLHEFDVVVLDATGCAEDSLRVLRRLRARIWRGSIIYVSERCTDLELDEVTRVLRVRAVFIKPLSLDELALRLPRLIPGTSAQPASASGHKSWGGALEHVRDDYGARLPEEVDRLDRAVHAARAAPTATTLGAAHDLAHAIHGTAGTFRFDMVSECAAAVEHELAHVLRGATEVHDREVWRRLVQLTALARAGVPTPKPGAVARASAAQPDPHAVRQAEIDGGVLVVTADPGLRARLADLAEARGLSLVTASNLAEAERAGNEGRLDAVFIDEQLPDDGGTMVLSALRRRPMHRDLPVNWIAPGPNEPLRRVHGDSARTLPRDVDATRFAAHVDELTRSRAVRPWRILLVDDDAAFAAALTAMFGTYRIEIEHLPTAVGLFDHLDRFKPDLVLVDLLMPFVSGYDVCRDVRRHARWAGLPIVVVTAQSSQLVRVSTYRAGADDFVLKPVVSEELIARVFAHLDRVRRAHDRDSSGALRRHPFLDAAAPLVAFEHSRGEPSTAVLVRLGGLREVNHRYGLGAGDDALRTVSERLASLTPRSAPVGRWTGSVFSSVLPGRNAASSLVEIGTWLKQLGEIVFRAPDGTQFRLPVRAGWSCTDRSGANIDALLTGAEAHLRRAPEAPAATVRS